MENLNEDIRRILKLMEVEKEDINDKEEDEDIEETEISEEGEESSGGSTSSSGTASKWADVVGSQLKRGPANKIKTEPWASGITKGPGNQSK